ncbi:hypothetical protein EJ02DRAFT_153005 [Clathrospora elynae]|uniref:Uncharacterized protein n=1 Tax=Clathrospora elynae TaxID=706981 RepID=A0A6A5STV4_9PLEO|nr:hypothetical protein EJ02DRAFT_153005 [Clathrospora elynae]
MHVRLYHTRLSSYGVIIFRQIFFLVLLHFGINGAKRKDYSRYCITGEGLFDIVPTGGITMHTLLQYVVFVYATLYVGTCTQRSVWQWFSSRTPLVYTSIAIV